jgi:hypothetical protein
MEVLDKPIYALSGYAEWFYCMCRNWKDVENRDWPLNRYFKPLNFPIRIYLHASKKPASNEEIAFIGSKLTKDQLAEFMNVDWIKLRGKIIGETTITKQLHKNNLNPISSIGSGGIFSSADEHFELEYLKKEVPEYFSPWFFGKYGFVVKDGILYAKPIPCKGQLGFFKSNF